ncbi:hypothetical protein KL86DYS1_11501 [uncultured Dysgonomonas sp.]|uniref:Uncharacterized protein n=1 Tax=uncultured Dysgonomonas sp. TaxID=206096 RepID=A0A212J8V9_9BACT|nr:hypothetical protein KL86DYS1_11501 [uncultured Dysgonomonas sp.]
MIINLLNPTKLLFFYDFKLKQCVILFSSSIVNIGYQYFIYGKCLINIIYLARYYILIVNNSDSNL